MNQNERRVISGLMQVTPKNLLKIFRQTATILSHLSNQSTSRITNRRNQKSSRKKADKRSKLKQDNLYWCSAKKFMNRFCLLRSNCNSQHILYEELLNDSKNYSSRKIFVYSVCRLVRTALSHSVTNRTRWKWLTHRKWFRKWSIPLWIQQFCFMSLKKQSNPKV